MKTPHLKLLAQVPLLAGLSEETLNALANACRFETVAKGTYIIQRHDESRRLFFLLSGQVRMLEVNRQGQEVALAIIDAPIHFGEMAVIDGYPRSAAVQATTKCEVASINPKDAETLIYNIPLVSKRIMQNLAAIIRRNNWHRVILQHQSIVNRLAAYLLSQIPTGTNPETTICFKNMPAQYDLGILLGTTRESISRAFSALEEEGLIRREGKSLFLTNLPGLQQLLDAE